MPESWEIRRDFGFFFFFCFRNRNFFIFWPHMRMHYKHDGPISGLLSYRSIPFSRFRSSTEHQALKLHIPYMGLDILRFQCSFVLTIDQKTTKTQCGPITDDQ